MTWVLICFTLVALVDLTPLIRRRKGRAIAAFLVPFALGLALAVLQALKVEIPSVMHAWGDLIRWLGLAYPP